MTSPFEANLSTSHGESLVVHNKISFADSGNSPCVAKHEKDDATMLPLLRLVGDDLILIHSAQVMPHASQTSWFNNGLGSSTKNRFWIINDNRI
jgi:hypothetical protein